MFCFLIDLNKDRPNTYKEASLAYDRSESKAGFTAIMAFMTAVERIAVIQSALVASSLGLESAIYSHKPKSDQDLKV
jgi:hypothetical protein